MEFSRLEYWRGYLFPSPGDLPNPGIQPRSPALQADSLSSEPPGKPKNTRVGIPSPGNLPNPGIKLGSPALQQILYQLNYQRSPSQALPNTFIYMFPLKAEL